MKAETEGLIAPPAAVVQYLDERSWPAEELQHLGKCPVCGAEERERAFPDMEDRVFFCAPGKWTSWRCGACHVAYLDPRPTPESIGKAYGHYYTHKPPVEEEARKKFIGRLLYRARIAVRNSYLNKTMGYHLTPALPLGWLAYVFIPSQIEITKNTIRHLPGHKNRNNCLLDIGSGNGEFLHIARDELGYEVEGIDFDREAAQVAGRNGINVHVTSMLGAGSGLEKNKYDQITLSHVVEHFHEPKAALAEVFDLLRSGGRVWIKIPNLGAASHARFGGNRYSLDVPRHLVMFDRDSIVALLNEIGFINPKVLLASVKECEDVFCRGWLVQQGYDPVRSSPFATPDDIQKEAAQAYEGAASEGGGTEILTIIADKP